MKISYNWLKAFIDIDLSVDEVASILTDLGLEVETYSNYQSIKGGLEGIVVGQVLECYKHPNADRLKITKVDVGLDEPLQIICGASNVSKGLKVAVATVGTTLYSNDDKPWTIEKSKIRGEYSFGMICAEDELGLGESHQGIMVLDENVVLGTKCSDLFEVENDQVFEIGITPNRADALSHYGMARDLRAGLLQRKKMPLYLKMPSVEEFSAKPNKATEICVENLELAPRYAGITLTDIVVKESPNWLKYRLEAIGITPKNNVVDITNYVLHELGQPLHAFDRDDIAGDKIVVKTLSSRTKFTTLDGVERQIEPSDLMICDVEKPLCIAGVFGGLTSGVSEKTTSVFLESAYFDPISIRKTAKRLSLNTDASFRFERGIDPENVVFALKRAAMLMVEFANAKIASDITDLYPKKLEPYKVSLDLKNLNKLVGETIDISEIKSILTTLEVSIVSENTGILELQIPFYRTDVQREVDVIEDILRVYGYNNIPTKTSLSIPTDTVESSSSYFIENKISNYLVSLGLTEIMTGSLTKETHVLCQDSQQVKIINSVSEGLSVMRDEMLYSGLEIIAYNKNRQQNNLKLFEFGNTYKRLSETEFDEKKHLTIFLSGNRGESIWNETPKPVDFFYLKSIVFGIFRALSFRKYKTNIIEESKIFSEGVVLQNGNSVFARLGLLNSQSVEVFGIKEEVLYADIDWNILSKEIQKRPIKVKDIPKFPEVSRDLSLLIDNATSFSQIEELAYYSEKNILKEVSLFDVYEGKGLPENKKSYGVNFIFQDPKKTLTDNQVDQVMSKLIGVFRKEIGATLR